MCLWLFFLSYVSRYNIRFYALMHGTEFRM